MLSGVHAGAEQMLLGWNAFLVSRACSYPQLLCRVSKVSRACQPLARASVNPLVVISAVWHATRMHPGHARPSTRHTWWHQSLNHLQTALLLPVLREIH